MDEREREGLVSREKRDKTGRLGYFRTSKGVFVTFIVFLLIGLLCVSSYFVVFRFIKNDDFDKKNNEKVAVFGRDMLLNEFQIDPSLAFLNHGSYGATPIKVMNGLSQCQHQMEWDTMDWFSNKIRPFMSEIRGLLAPFIGANEEDVVLVENASGGVNSVLRSLDFAKGQKILYLDIAYGMVKKTLDFLKARWDIELIQVNITFPNSMDNIVQIVADQLDEHKPILFAVSHISSTPAVILPVKELASECRNRNISILVDGAHALGQIHINVTDIGADYYLSNGHKWLYSPKGSAFLWVNPIHQPSTHPTVIYSSSQAFGYDTSPNSFQKEFEWVGTRDYCPYVAMKDALQFVNKIGVGLMRTYQHDLCLFANDLFQSTFPNKTGNLLNDEKMWAAMTNIRIQLKEGITVSDASSIFSEDKIRVVVYEFDRSTFLRISCQIYNDQDDIRRLVNSAKKVMD